MSDKGLKMKKHLCIFLAGISMSSFAIANMNVSIDGEIKDQTCDIKTGYKHLVVHLPKVGIASLRKAGETIGHQAFKIELENCKQLSLSAGKKIIAFFDSPDVDTTNGYTLPNTATTNKATHVNIQLLNKDGSAIKVTNAVNNHTTFKNEYEGPVIQETQSKYVLEYAVRYYATGIATAGDVTAVANYTIQYR